MADKLTTSRMEIVVFAVLLLALALSALGVIYSKDRSRAIFIEIEKQEKIIDQADVEWGQLQLELTTLAEQNRVESIARDRLKLIVPPRDKIIYIKP